MLHCRSTSHLRRTRLSRPRTRSLAQDEHSAPLASDASLARNPARTTVRDAVTPRPTKASDGQLPPMRITPDAKPPQGVAMYGIRTAKSGMPKVGHDAIPGSRAFDRVNLHSAPRTER